LFFHRTQFLVDLGRVHRRGGRRRWWWWEGEDVCLLVEVEVEIEIGRELMDEREEREERVRMVVGMVELPLDDPAVVVDEVKVFLIQTKRVRASEEEPRRRWKEEPV